MRTVREKKRHIKSARLYDGMWRRLSRRRELHDSPEHFPPEEAEKLLDRYRDENCEPECTLEIGWRRERMWAARV